MLDTDEALYQGFVELYAYGWAKGASAGILLGAALGVLIGAAAL